VKQPKGDWEDGETWRSKFAGLGTGIGKGVGGFVLKNANAVYAPPAFVVKGLIKYVENKHEGPGSKAFLRRSQIVQGEQDEWELQKDETEEGKAELERIQTAVHEGWSVYERIWAEAHKEFGPVGGNLVGKYRFKKEQRNWDVNGALENVETAHRALEARREGRDLDKFFDKRRQEVRAAEAPRAPAMQQPKTFDEEKGDVLPNGRLVNGSKDGPDGAGADLSGSVRSTSSDGVITPSTAITTPEDDRTRCAGKDVQAAMPSEEGQVPQTA
jgi:hypothetical protein